MVQKAFQVETKQEKTGSYWQFLAVLFTLVSQVALAQKPEVLLSVDKKEISRDERVTITVTSNVQGSMKIDFPSEFEVDFGVMHGMEQKMDQSGKIKTFYYMQQSGMFKKDGSFSFTATTIYHNKTYKSNKITIKVSEPADEEISKIRSDDPVFGVIQSKKTSVYEGEPIVMKAKVFSYINIEYLEGYSAFKSDLSMEEHVFPNGRVEVDQTKINGKDALTFEYGKQLLIPIGTGKCRIKPFEMALRCQGSIFAKTVRFKSSGLTIDIKPLTSGAPKDFIGAVGEYRMAQKNPTKDIQAGDVITLELVISGVGNLHNSNTPKLKLPKGCSIYGDPERVENIDFTENGAEGSITYRYNIQVLETQDLEFQAPSISYFNPEKEKYITIVGKPFSLHVVGGGNLATMVEAKNTQKTPESAALQNNPKEELENVKAKRSSAFWWGVAAPSTLLGLLLVVLFIRKKKLKGIKPVPSLEGNKAVLSANFIQESPSVACKGDINYWDKAMAALDQPNQFSVLFPKAIIQRVEHCEKCFFQSREKAFDRLTEAYPEVAKGLRAIIEACDQYRYGLGIEELNTHDLVEKAEKWIAQLPK